MLQYIVVGRFFKLQFMTTEKLEMTRDFLAITSLTLTVIVFIMAVSLAVISVKLSKTYKAQIEKTTHA